MSTRRNAFTPNALQLFCSASFACCATLASAQTVEAIDGVNLTVDDILINLLGTSLTVTQSEFTGEEGQLGRFSDYGYLFGETFDQGILLSTGQVESVVAVENTNDKSTTQFNEISISDPDLGNGVYDLAKLSITFYPVYDSVTLDFIFGSEEYNEYVATEFNDRLEILVNGENCAKTPDDKVFSINTVNDREAYPPLFGDSGASSNPDLYINNDPGLDTNGSDEPESPSVAVYATEMDGFTQLIQCRASVIPNEENHLVIGIVDEGDAQLDSWAFFRARSFVSTPDTDDDSPNPDSDNDGIPDSVESPDGIDVDTDDDNIVDRFDLDSDNDGIPDAVEFQGDTSADANLDGLLDADQTAPLDTAPIDSDNDGTADYLDFDSDNDSLTDLAESVTTQERSAELDANQDGVLDDMTDIDNDGLLDIVDPAIPGGEPGQPHSLMDLDGDALFNYRDADSEGDGIGDRIEVETGAHDFDSDGLVNWLDLDSDNDGIPDSVEFQGTQSVDMNLDGRIDSVQRTSLNTRPVDTDGDATPDFLDLDSDGDTLTDLLESISPLLLLSVIDADDNGVLDSTLDEDHDGLLDVVDASVTGSTAGTPHKLLDLDDDGLYNYRDIDSDGDAFEDNIENGDFDKDGINDRLQVEPGLKTAVSGIGSFGWEILMILPLIFGFRQTQERS